MGISIVNDESILQGKFFLYNLLEVSCSFNVKIEHCRGYCLFENKFLEFSQVFVLVTILMHLNSCPSLGRVFY